MEFRIKRGADEGADHRLARLLNPNRLAGAIDANRYNTSVS
jgi:hypothetical protein